MKLLKNKKIPYLIFYVFLAIVLKYIYKKTKTKPSVSNQDSAMKIVKTVKASVNAVDMIDIANAVSHHLGTQYAKYNPLHWTENDEQVFELIKPLSMAEFNVVSKLYNELYAKGRSLSSDLAKLLDSKYYEQLKIK